VRTHILLVEDSDLVSAALRILFEEHGYRVTVVTSAADAIHHVSAAPPDLMLLDLGLPDANGLTVLEALADRGVELPVTVALTGTDDPATTAKCLDWGCREVLVKPVPARELVGRVARYAG
jgi:DNA-binding response OmpR family regulator